MYGSGDTAPVDRDFPVFTVVCLAQTREKDGIYRCASRVRVLVALVVHGSVHQASPIYESCPYKQPCTFLLRCIVYSQRCIRICGISGLVCLFRHAVLMQVVASQSSADTDASVNYREFPVIPVVYLRYAWHYDRAGEHRTYSQIPLVCDSAEQFLEREHLVGCIIGGSGVIRLIVCLGKRLFLELCACTDGKAEYEYQNDSRISQDILHHLRCGCSQMEDFSSALRNLCISSSELKWIVMVPLPPDVRFRLMLLVKYLPTISRTLK